MPEGGVLDSNEGRLYQEMFDEQVALSVAQRGTLGARERRIAALAVLEAQHAPEGSIDQDRLEHRARRVAAELQRVKAILAGSGVLPYVSQPVEDSAASGTPVVAFVVAKL